MNDWRLYYTGTQTVALGFVRTVRVLSPDNLVSSGKVGVTLTLRPKAGFLFTLSNDERMSHVLFEAGQYPLGNVCAQNNTAKYRRG